MSVLISLNPRSFLDIGCGFGRWGFLAREFCDIFQGRYDKSTWKTRIDGVEVFEEYIRPHHKYIYDKIYICKIEDFINDMNKYDVIFAGDVIEHLEKSEAKDLLEKLFSKYNKSLIVAVPLGNWYQGEVFGNPYETHRSIWLKEDLEELKPRYIKLYDVNNYPKYGVAIWSNQRIFKS